MVEFTEVPNKRGNQTSPFRSKDLILTINRDEKIIKFNEVCEKISGYSLESILAKNFFDVLIPDRYLEQWKRIIDYVRKNKAINDFRLPILTRHGHEIMVSWSSFPVEKGERNISLVGKLVTSWNTSDDNVNVPIKVNVKNYNDFNRVIKDLMERNKELEIKNKELEKKLNEKTPKHRDLMGSGLYSFSDIVGGKKRMKEIESLIKELDVREKQLNVLMFKLTKDKKMINNRRNEFIEWRKKLESLERDLERRNTELLKQEKLLSECLLMAKKGPLQNRKIIKPAEPEIDPLEGIQECAAVIQRGILKKVTPSFTKLFGYVSEDIVNKSIFDIIVPDGFSTIENYYFKRLKGEDINSFETVFFTKNNTKIPVKVLTRPTSINSEKAEIAIFRRINEEQKIG